VLDQDVHRTFASLGAADALDRCIYGEIADLTGRSPRTVDRHLRRARSTVRAH
jgi:DNA-directed RNA polymerase specialized sigma24 family protein